MYAASCRAGVMFAAPSQATGIASTRPSRRRERRHQRGVDRRVDELGQQPVVELQEASRASCRATTRRGGVQSVSAIDDDVDAPQRRAAEYREVGQRAQRPCASAVRPAAIAAARTSTAGAFTGPPSRRCPAAPALVEFAGRPSNFLTPSCRPITCVQNSRASSTSWMLHSTGTWSSARDLADQAHDFARDLRVEARRRLVDQQQARILDQRPGDADALPLAAGEAIGALVDVLAQADAIEQRQRLPMSSAREHAHHAAQRAGVAEPAGQHVVHAPTAARSG